MLDRYEAAELPPACSAAAMGACHAAGAKDRMEDAEDGGCDGVGLGGFLPSQLPPPG